MGFLLLKKQLKCMHEMATDKQKSTLVARYHNEEIIYETACDSNERRSS